MTGIITVKDICIFAFAFVKHAYLLICKMNYHTDIVNFRERLLGRGAYFENLTFWRGAL